MKTASRLVILHLSGPHILCLCFFRAVFFPFFGEGWWLEALNLAEFVNFIYGTKSTFATSSELPNLCKLSMDPDVFVQHLLHGHRNHHNQDHHHHHHHHHVLQCTSLVVVIFMLLHFEIFAARHAKPTSWSPKNHLP